MSTPYPEPSDPEDDDYDPAEEEEEDDDGVMYIDQETLAEILADGEDDDEDDEDELDEEASNGIEVHIESPNGDAVEEAAARRIVQRRLLRYIQSGRIYRLANERFDEDEDDEDDLYSNRRRRRRREPPDPDRFPKVPNEEGSKLMAGGRFGCDGEEEKLVMRLLDREVAGGSPAGQRLNMKLMAQGMIPSSNADMIVHYNQPVYSGQFSDDGNFFFAVNKDFRVRMYDTSNPYKWRYYKTVEYPFGRWTLTDASLSPDNKYLAYTSIQSAVCLAPTDPNDHGDPYILDLGATGGNPLNMGYRGGNFGIWSIRYSGDGRELVAGCGGGLIVVYDIESRTPMHRILGHDEDVNAVCFADTASPHILYSGSDDTTLKVWDTRSLGDARAAGVFVGHIEGLTYIDSKGDGRYILSNGKDQSMKLWDIRMVMPNSQFEAIKPTRRATNQRFDYRFGGYDEDDWYADPHDNSLVTYRGHKVLKTLIRCHFSPPGSTNSRYVYSGSADGKVYIWNLDATPAGIIDVQKATLNSRPRGANLGGWNDYEDDDSWRTCVRDASWHPNAPVIAASAWNGYGYGNGTVTVHGWNDGAEGDEGGEMGERVDERLKRRDEFYRTEMRPRRRGVGLGALLRGE